MDDGPSRSGVAGESKGTTPQEDLQAKATGFNGLDLRTHSQKSSSKNQVGGGKSKKADKVTDHKMEKLGLVQKKQQRPSENPGQGLGASSLGNQKSLRARKTTLTAKKKSQDHLHEEQKSAKYAHDRQLRTGDYVLQKTAQRNVTHKLRPGTSK